MPYSLIGPKQVKYPSVRYSSILPRSYHEFLLVKNLQYSHFSDEYCNNTGVYRNNTPSRTHFGESLRVFGPQLSTLLLALLRYLPSGEYLIIIGAFSLGRARCFTPYLPPSGEYSKNYRYSPSGPIPQGQYI